MFDNFGKPIQVIARPSEARPWQSQGCEICISKTEVISKSLELNEITTSCALHTPRNDRELLCHPENVIIAGSRIKKCPLILSTLNANLKIA